MTEASLLFKLIGSLLYNESSAETIGYLKEQSIFDDIPYAAEQYLVVLGQQDICGWLEGASVEELADAAASDYMKLFIGVGKMSAPPWGSCYMTEDRLIFQKQTLMVREYYAYYGMQLQKKYSEPDDHIGLEMEFIASLLEQEEIDAALHFAQTHMQPWITDWMHAVEEHAQTAYYKGLARLAVGAVAQLLHIEQPVNAAPSGSNKEK